MISQFAEKPRVRLTSQWPFWPLGTSLQKISNSNDLNQLKLVQNIIALWTRHYFYFQYPETTDCDYGLHIGIPRCVLPAGEQAKQSHFWGNFQHILHHFDLRPRRTIKLTSMSMSLSIHLFHSSRIGNIRCLKAACYICTNI